MNTDMIFGLKDNIGKVIVGKDQVVELAHNYFTDIIFKSKNHVRIHDSPPTWQLVLT